MSLWKKLYGVIWGSPAKTMGQIVERPRFWGAAAVMLIISLLLSLPILPKIREATIWSLQNAAGGVKMTAAQIDSIANYAVYSTPVLSALIPFLLWLVIAALLKLFNAFTGDKAPFKAFFAIVVFSYLPVFIEGIIKTPLIMATSSQKMAHITISLALFLPPPDAIPGKMYVFLSQLDPFLIWSLALTALGASIAMKVSIKKTGIYLGSLWLVFALALTLLSGRTPS